MGVKAGGWQIMQYISNDNIAANRDLYTGSSLSKAGDASAIEKKKAVANNPYAKASAGTSDSSNISDEALKLYEKEKDVQKYKNLVMSTLNEPEDFSALDDILMQDTFGVDNNKLASSLSGSRSFMSMLFAD